MKATINNKPVEVHADLRDFELHKKASTNINYFGIQRSTNSFIAQYNTGAVYRWKGVPVEVLEEAVHAESIGKFVHAKLKGYDREVLETNMIKPVKDEE